MNPSMLMLALAATLSLGACDQGPAVINMPPLGAESPRPASPPATGKPGDGSTPVVVQLAASAPN